MAQKHYRAGEILFREGEPSDYACHIISGKADIVKQNEGEVVILGTARAGDFVGEMGVIQASPRIATVRAASPLTVEVIQKDAFLARISEDSQLAFRLLSRLSDRLKVVSQALVEAVTMGEARVDMREPGGNTSSTTPGIRVFADSNRLSRLLPPEGVLVNSFPFVVGRLSREEEIQPTMPVDLSLRDRKPFRLSRVHFSIDRSDGTYVVRDLRSSLGTEVNGQSLGEQSDSDQAPLRKGDNSIIAGGKDSSYRFLFVLKG